MWLSSIDGGIIGETGVLLVPTRRGTRLGDRRGRIGETGVGKWCCFSYSMGLWAWRYFVRWFKLFFHFKIISAVRISVCLWHCDFSILCSATHCGSRLGDRRGMDWEDVCWKKWCCLSLILGLWVWNLLCRLCSDFLETKKRYFCVYGFVFSCLWLRHVEWYIVMV